MAYFTDDDQITAALQAAAQRNGTGDVPNYLTQAADQPSPMQPGLGIPMPTQVDPWNPPEQPVSGTPTPMSTTPLTDVGGAVADALGGTGAPAPQSVPGTPRPNPKTDPIGAAQWDQDRAAENVANATAQTGVTQLQAAGEKIARQANVIDQSNNKQAELDRAYQAQRAEARKRADEETGRWLQDMERLAKTEPNHQRYWQNQDSFGKGLWLLGMAFSSMAQLGQKNAGQRNSVMEMLQQEIAQDVEAQKESLSRQMNVKKVQGDILQRNQMERIADLKEDHSLYFMRLEGLKQAALLRANAPGAADMKLAYQMGAQKLAELQNGIVANRANEAFTAHESALARGNAFAIAKMHDATELLKAQMEIGARQSAAKNGLMKDYSAIPTTQGIRVLDDATGKPIGPGVDEKGQPTGAFYVKEKNEEKVRQLAADAQQTYSAMKRVSAALHSDTPLEILLQKDPQLEADLIKLAYSETKANEPGGRVTDKDLQVNMKAVLGADLTTFRNRAFTEGLGSGQAKLADFMDRHIKDYKGKVENALRSELPAELPEFGSKKVRVEWTPQELTAPEPAKETYAGKMSRYGIEVPQTNNLNSQEAFDTAQKAGTLPAYAPNGGDKPTQQLVNEFKTDMAGATSTTVRQLAEKAIDAVRNDPRAARELAQAADTQVARVANVERALVMSGYKTPDAIVEQGKQLGLDIPDDQAQTMSKASTTATKALDWWREQRVEYEKTLNSIKVAPGMEFRGRVRAQPQIQE